MVKSLDDLRASIPAREKRIAEARRQLEIDEAELRGIKFALAQLDGMQTEASVSQAIPSRPVTLGYRGGRQPGSITRPWRVILSELYHDYNRGFFPDAAVISYAHKQGLIVRPRDVRDRFSSYIEHKYAETNGAQWRVTDHAAQKFGFLEKKLETNEAPAAEAEEPTEFP